MAQVAGTRYSYSDAAYSINPLSPQKRAIADMIDMIEPKEVPLLKYLGIGEKGSGGGSKASKFRITNWPSTRVQWLEDTLAPISSTLAETMAATNATATLQLTFGAANYWRHGDVLLVDNERLFVETISGISATVQRLFGGSAVQDTTSHATSAVVTLIGRARDEGATSEADYTTQVVDKYNYTQIWQAEVKVTRTQNKMMNYGMGAEYDYQLSKKFVEQLKLLEATLYNGVRLAGSATTNVPRSMGGLKTFITTNTASLSSAALTQKDLEDKIQQAWVAGGNPNLIVCNAWVKRKISSFYAPYVRTTRTESTGGVTIDTIETEFGTLEILMDRWCPSTELYILSPEYIGILPFDPFFDEPLAKTGDFMAGQIVGEYTMIVKNDTAHARLIGISTTS